MDKLNLHLSKLLSSLSNRGVFKDSESRAFVARILFGCCLGLLNITAFSQVTNTNTLAVFPTIQAAIDAPATMDGHTITVATGIYSENITISKALTITGPNLGIAGTGVRGAEAVVSDGSINITSGGIVVLDGFHIYQTNGTSAAILLGGSAIATIQNSKIERVATVAGQGVRAIEVISGSGAKTIKNNLFTGSTSGGLFGGHKTWNNGIYINGASSTIAVLGNTFENVRSAVNVDDYNSGINLTGNFFKINGTDISFGGASPTAGVQTLGANDFVFPLDGIINLSNVDNTFRLNMSTSTFNGALFNTLSLSDLFLIEARMYHRGRSGRKGLVYYVAGNQYVVSGLTTIQSAVDYGVANDIINVNDGTYNERVSITKTLNLTGKSKAGTILEGTGLVGTGSAFDILTGIINVTVQNFTIQNFTGSSGNSHAGIYGNAGNNNLTVKNVSIKNNLNSSGIYANGPISDVLIDGVEAINNGGGARGIVLWNGLKKNITIKNSTIQNNTCCGIELQDGSASGVLIQNNTIVGNDNAIGLIGLTSGSGTSTPNIIENNIITVKGRFGIEVKNPNGTGLMTGDGAILIQNNNISFIGGIADARDLAGIAVYRRGVLGGNVDVPNGVVVKNNTIKDFAQPSTSDGFGIVIEGTNHTITGNNLQGNDVALQQQAGFGGYPGDGDQTNLADAYFGRGNSPATCGNTINSNTFTSNTINNRNVGTSGGGFVVNTTQSTSFCSIQAAVNAANSNDIINVPGAVYNESLVLNKTLTLKGANATKCGTDGSRVTETTLVAPTSGALISLSGSVSATFEGFLIDGQFVANVAAASQNLTIRNSVFELDFTPGSNNLYFSSETLTLDCNYFKAISGSNDGSSTHIFFAGAALSATNNKFTSEAARAFMNISGTTSLPVWLNITSNANNANVHHNEFVKIDMGILLAANAGNVTIENNEFKEALRETLPGGVGQGTGIAIFENLTPAAPILIRYNKFVDSEAGIRTSGNGTSFPAANLLTISYNSFVGLSDKAIRIGATYGSAPTKLNAPCNWFGAITGPIIATNPGAGGAQILDPSNKVSFRNWLMYGTDTDAGQLGLQLPTSINVSPGNNISVAENHYRILSNAIGCAMTGQTVTLAGTFDYTNTIAKSEWVKGNDGEAQGAVSAFFAGSGDDYSILAPARTENVTVTSASLGSATIDGPGEIAATALESFLFFNSNAVTSSFKGWTISNLKINNFDASIGADHNNGSIAVMENFKIVNNEFLIPSDLNKSQEADNFQNIGIHMNYGKNQEVKNNKFVVDGTGVSDGTTSYSTSVVLQSATSGGDAYDGLKIQNNQVHVTGVPNGSNPARIIGIWENSNNQSGAIDISGNTFVNDDAGNLSQNNKQLAFRVTSFSGDATHQVVYQNNEITGFNRAIDWIGDPFSSYTPNAYNTGTNPVIVQNNKIANVMYGVTVRKKNPSDNPGSPAIINNNSFTGIATGGFAIVNEGTGETDAECNWYDNPLTANVISSMGGGSVRFNPKLSTGTDNDGAIGFQPVPNSCVLPVFNYTKNFYYSTIQGAIDAGTTTSGDEIRVSTGIYPENILVNKGVTIIGADSANVIVDKGPANFSGTGGAGFRLAADGITLSKMKVQNFNNGIETETATTAVTIEQMNVNKNYSNGFFGKRSATDLKIQNSNFNSNGVSAGGAQTGSYMRGFMFEAQADAVITNLKVLNNSFKSNGLVGIDISGLIPTQGILIDHNDVWNNFDSQIGVSLELNSLTLGETSIINNNLKISGTARYGIEIKNPLGTGSAAGAGSIVVSANTIAVVNHTGTVRDLAAIAVMRRKGGYSTINDQPQGVRVINNIINDFQNTGDAFGIVLGGIGHLVGGNTITNTKISIQLQKGNTNFNTDANSPNSIDDYFERDNSGDVCVEIGANTIDGLSGAPRFVIGPSSTSPILPPVRVTNIDLSAKFCTIQQAINFTATTTGHVLDAIASDYPENVIVNKSVVLQGPNKLVAGSGGRGAEASIIPPSDDIANGVLVKVEANDVTVKGFAIDGANSALASTLLINGSKTQAAFGVKVLGEFTGLKIENNIVRNISKHGVELDANNGSTQGNSITGNWFDNIPRYHGDGFYGRGVILANNFYASVLNNKFTRVERGVQTNNFSKAILSGTWEIKGNDITAYNIGAFINLHYQATTDLSFENNTIDKDVTTRTITSGTLDPLPDTDFTGVEVFSIADAVKVTLKGGVIKNAFSGIYSWNNSSSNHVTVDGVAFNTNGVAVIQSNFSRYTGAADSEIDIKNVTVVDGNTVKAFVAEDHASGSGAISSINLVSGNVITSSGGFTHPFHLQGGTKARIKAGGSTVTPSSQDVFTFNVTGTSSTANVVIKAGLIINLAGSTKRVVTLPAGLIMQMDGDFTAPNKVTDNPVLINGALWFNSGILNSGNGSIEFGSTASDIMTGSNPEKATSYILGKAMLLSRAVGGDAIDMLGVKMLEGPSVGNLVITRTTKTSGSTTPAFPADASIRTVWEITPSITSASRGDVQFRYLNLASNINSQNPAAIYAYRYNTGTSQWEKKSALRSSAAVADVFTTQAFGVAEFSSWTLSSTEPGPDLRPLIVMSDVGFIKPSALSKNATLRLYNVGGVGTTATGLITVYIYPPNDKFTIALGASPDWSLTYNSGGNYYTLTSINTTINYGAAEYKTVNLNITAVSTVSKGKYGILFEVDGGSGGETNNLNNTVGVEIGVSGI